MLHKQLAHICAGALLSLGFVMQAAAGISVGGTRVIYDEAKREASISIRNLGTSPYVVQAWIDTGKSGEKAPLIVTPPLSRLDGSKENILRIVRTAGALPADRESVFWLNVKEIPVKLKDKNILQVALRTRIKVFYRPAGMRAFDGGSVEAPAALEWAVVPAADGHGRVLRIANPSPYHVTLASLVVKGTRDEEIDADMIPPLGAVSYPISGTASVAPVHVVFSTVNDYGAYSDPRQIDVPAGSRSQAIVAGRMKQVSETGAAGDGRK